MKVLAYFDVFDYPVSGEEIQFFLDQRVKEADLKASLEALTDAQLLFRLNGFYSLHDNPLLAERRIRGNQRAEKLLKTATRSSRFLFQFPYVRGIGISGSLSKNYADEKADIDYFIITRSNRLWIARTIMHLFKKLSFLVGKQHWFCMNYFVDEEEMEIPEKNIFTAIEMITLLPAGGKDGLVKFFEANDWALGYLPNYRFKKRQPKGSWRNSLLKRMVEKLFSGRMGDRLDKYFQDLTTRRWREKEESGKLTDKGFKQSLRTGRHYSRSNPEMLQQRILGKYEDKLKELKTKWGVISYGNL